MNELRITRRHAAVLNKLQSMAGESLPFSEIPDGLGQAGRVTGKTLRELRIEEMIEFSKYGEYRITSAGFAALSEYFSRNAPRKPKSRRP